MKFLDTVNSGCYNTILRVLKKALFEFTQFQCQKKRKLKKRYHHASNTASVFPAVFESVDTCQSKIGRTIPNLTTDFIGSFLKLKSCVVLVNQKSKKKQTSFLQLFSLKYVVQNPELFAGVKSLFEEPKTKLPNIPSSFLYLTTELFEGVKSLFGLTLFHFSST